MKRITKKDHNFWQKLPKPFFALAPMANVTDSVFRKIIAKYGKPDVMWTEFVSADGLISAGQKKLLVDLEYSNKERPIVAQLFTGHPETMRKAAKIIADLGFDGLDINMGCPDRSVEKQGGGAAMMKNQELAIEVLNAAREGVGAPFADDISPTRPNRSALLSLVGGSVGEGRATKSVVYDSTIPVSVKTRIGYTKIDLGWIRLLMEQKLPVLTVHLRTRREMSDVPAHWEIMLDIIKLRNEISQSTLIVGNGDVDTIEDGLLKCKKYGCDGVMIGRGIFGKPWLFGSLNESRTSVTTKPTLPPTRLSRAERLGLVGEMSSAMGVADLRLKIMLEHARLFDKTFCGEKHLKNFAVMKKHFKAYVSGWKGAKELRVKLMDTNNFKEVKKVVEEYLYV